MFLIIHLTLPSLYCMYITSVRAHNTQGSLKVYYTPNIALQLQLKQPLIIQSA